MLDKIVSQLDSSAEERTLDSLSRRVVARRNLCGSEKSSGKNISFDENSHFSHYKALLSPTAPSAALSKLSTSRKEEGQKAGRGEANSLNFGGQTSLTLMLADGLSDGDTYDDVIFSCPPSAFKGGYPEAIGHIKATNWKGEGNERAGESEPRRTPTFLYTSSTAVYTSRPPPTYRRHHHNLHRRRRGGPKTD